MSLYEKIINEIKVLFYKRGIDEKFEFSGSDDKINIKGDNLDYSINNPNELSNEEMLQIKHDIINKIIDRNKESNSQYTYDKCLKEFSDGLQFITNNNYDENIEEESQYTLSSPYSEIVYVNPQFLKYKMIDIKTTTEHNLKAYEISSGLDGLDILLIPDCMHSHILYTNILTNGWINKKHNMYTFDPRGQGNSDCPDPEVGRYGSIDQNADDINSVITMLNLKKGNIVLIGHSFGWLRIGDYISKYGDNYIKGLVCINGISDVGFRNYNDIYLNFLGEFTNTFFSTHIEKINNYANLIQYTFMSDPGTNLSNIITADIWSVRKDICIAILAHESTSHINHTWPKVNVPTFIQWGEHNNILNTKCLKEIYNAINHSTLKIYNAKHYPFIDCHNDTLNDLINFLNNKLNI